MGDGVRVISGRDERGEVVTQNCNDQMMTKQVNADREARQVYAESVER